MVIRIIMVRVMVMLLVKVHLIIFFIQDVTRDSDVVSSRLEEGTAEKISSKVSVPVVIILPS